MTTTGATGSSPTDDQRFAEMLRRCGDPTAIVDAFERVPAVIAYFEGPDLVLRAANAALRDLYKRQDVIGLPLREASPVLGGQEIYELLEKVFAEQRPYTGIEWRMMFDPHDPDSEVVMTFSLIPVRNPDGSPRGLVAHSVDVTAEVQERRAAQERIAGAEQKLEAAQQVLFTLQRYLLPDSVPVLPQVRLAAHYLVAEAELQAGGDWFDAVPLGGGRIALVVGDVVGHGAEAAAAMARLQTILHEALQRPDADIAEAVRWLDASAARTPATRAATVCIAVLDPGAGTIEYVCRAHPPPLVCRPDGRTEYLPHTHGGPLGVRGVSPAPVTRKLDPGDAVLLYTDGLIERPGETVRDGLDRLARVAAAAVTGGGRTTPRMLADRLTTLAVERITRWGIHDDVTLLAAHVLREPVAPLVLDVRADAAELAGLREAVSDWLEPLGVRPTDALGVMLAVCEAATNVVEHAYVDRLPGRLGVVADLDGNGAIRLTVDDDGTWRAPAGGPGGRGISLMRAVCDEMVIDSGGAGTSVAMTVHPRHSTVVGRDEDGTPPPVPAPRAEFRTTVTDQPGDRPRVVVHGPVDATTTPLLQAAVQRYEARSVVIDLSPVTLLASAGVQFLYRLTEDHPVELHAPAGCPARYVLDLTDLGSRVLP
jgi:serine phosphatase RsbU (regulator of sigma subunit)/anti-sigma regulatory factor (Ser/Thr protein kinase)